VFTVYRDPEDDSSWRAIVSVLKTIPRESIMAASKLSPRAVRDILAHRTIPHPDNQNRLRHLATTHARGDLRKRGLDTPKEMTALFELLATQKPH
jgi:hypothetical protein